MRQLRLFPRWPLGALASGLLLADCSQPLEEPAYRAYLQDEAHGLTQRVARDGAVATCTYRPTDLLVAQELATGRLARVPAVVDSLRQAYAGRSYFALTLAQNGQEIENQFINDRTTYGNAIGYLSAGIAADVHLVTPARDSVPALTAVYPRLYGATGQSTVLLVFDTQRLDLADGCVVSFHDTRFGLGTLRFPFAAGDLAAVPPLRF